MNRIARVLILTLGLSGVVASSQAVEWQGQFTQGALLIGTLAPGEQVFYQDKALKLTPQGQFVLGFGRDAELEQQVTVISVEGVKQDIPLRLKKRDYDIQRINGVPQKMVTPNKDKLARIRSENALVAKARKTDTERLAFLQPFIWPAKGPISGVYGSQRFFNDEPRRPHFGLDIAAPKGAPVLAPADGSITLAHDGMYFSGATLIMDHGFGVSSTFIHLDEILVKEGQEVKQGELIARVGDSGRATGPHLDWRINWYQVRIDPRLLVSGSPE
ncbi:MAG: M23 family metallopeptidase [Pseudomonadales bacterium]|nr:M23 family metallopeptidase [Pseudomonadales bacterium]